MQAHVTEIETLHIPAGEGYRDQRFRWRCSCGAVGPKWRPRALQARQGAAKHQAAMERGKP